MFRAALFTIARIQKQPKFCQQMNKDVVYIYNGIFLPFAASWVDLENIRPSEKSQTEKDKYCMLSLICVM